MNRGPETFSVSASIDAPVPRFSSLSPRLIDEMSASTRSSSGSDVLQYGRSRAGPGNNSVHNLSEEAYKSQATKDCFVNLQVLAALRCSSQPTDMAPIHSGGVFGDRLEVSVSCPVGSFAKIWRGSVVLQGSI